MSKPGPKKKKIPAAKISLLIFFLIILSIAFTYAAFTDIIMLRKTEDMKGSEEAIALLFVGNSQVFVGDLPRQLQIIAKAQGIEIIYKDISRHGNRGGSLGELKESAISEIESGRFDYVVLHENSRRLTNAPEDFQSDVQFLIDKAKENGVIPVLFNPSGWKNNDGLPDETRYRAATESYQRAADENDIDLINVGEVWIYAYQTIPDISLYVGFDFRGPHHASKAGGFLTACVFAANLFDLQIEEIPKNNLYKGNDAIELAKIAWEFYNK